MSKKKKFKIPEIKRTIYDCTLPFESEPHYVVFVEATHEDLSYEGSNKDFKR